MARAGETLAPRCERRHISAGERRAANEHVDDLPSVSELALLRKAVLFATGIAIVLLRRLEELETAIRRLRSNAIAERAESSVVPGLAAAREIEGLAENGDGVVAARD